MEPLETKQTKGWHNFVSFRTITLKISQGYFMAISIIVQVNMACAVVVTVNPCSVVICRITVLM